MNEGHDVPSVGSTPPWASRPLCRPTRPTCKCPSFLSTAPPPQQLGGTGANKLPSQSIQLFRTWMKTKGNHTLKSGGDFRQYRLNTFSTGDFHRHLPFNNNWVTGLQQRFLHRRHGPGLRRLPVRAALSGSYHVDLNTFASWYSYYAAGVRAGRLESRRATSPQPGPALRPRWPLQREVRPHGGWFQHHLHESAGRRRQAAYAKAPIAQLPASAFNVLGGLTFPGSGQTAVYQNHSHLVSPRLGWPGPPNALTARPWSAAASACSSRRSPSPPWASTASTPPAPIPTRKASASPPR